jgi:hypothetical protein
LASLPCCDVKQQHPSNIYNNSSDIDALAGGLDIILNMRGNGWRQSPPGSC